MEMRHPISSNRPVSGLSLQLPGITPCARLDMCLLWTPNLLGGTQTAV